LAISTASAERLSNEIPAADLKDVGLGGGLAALSPALPSTVTDESQGTCTYNIAPQKLPKHAAKLQTKAFVQPMKSQTTANRCTLFHTTHHSHIALQEYHTRNNHVILTHRSRLTDYTKGKAAAD
jgi:hypothetical protein